MTDKDARIVLGEKVRAMLIANGHKPDDALDRPSGVEIGQVDGVYVYLVIRELSGKWKGVGRFARSVPTGKIRMTCGGYGDKSVFLQRKDGSHDMDRLLMRVREIIAKKKNLDVRSAKVGEVVELLDAAPQPACVQQVRVLGPETVSIVVAVSPSRAVSLLSAIQAWETKA